ncbi:MAG: substrate-binding domain-containing protein [Actinomycetes bacterium]|jgi:branched-chain amino acid transport system substrate-binding protein|nr:amino acid ABC transporter substrate-binding protein [Acidimicrobiia bacterium]
MRRAWIGILAVIALAAAACGGSTDTTTTPSEGAPATTEPTTADTTADTGGEASGEPIRVGIITSTSGPLQSYGQQYLAGLEAGLDYATDGTRAVNGRPIEFLISDDGGDPEAAISQATDLVGQGVNIIAGTVVSGVAVQLAGFAEENDILYIAGPAATDAITGVNDNTFRSGRQSLQDVATAAALVEGEGGNVLVFAQDTEFGAANVAAVEAVLGSRGFTVDSLLVPASETEFTGFADQINQAAPDLVFVAWAGETSGAMWQALNQQNVFDAAPVATGLGDKVTWPFYGDAATGLSFLNHYFEGAPDNEVNDYLVENAEVVDLFTPDGFVAAQMIVRAVSEGSPDDVASMISALEGWTFDAPKGTQTIRESDHAMLQPMFIVRLVEAGEGEYEAELVDALDPEATAPPES